MSEEHGDSFIDDYDQHRDEQPGAQTNAGSASTPPELLQQIGHYIVLILVPLLFGGLTSLIILPSVTIGHASVPVIALWPIAVVIILITIAQAITVYYADTHNRMWILATIVGLFLFSLLGCFTLYGIIAGLLLLVALIFASTMLVRFYLRPVPEGYVEITYAFGKYSHTLSPGPNLLLPWEKLVHSLNIEETQWICPKQTVPLSRDEDVVLRAAISYQLLPEDAHLAVTQVKDWEESLRQLLTTTLQTIATTFTADVFIPRPQGLHSSPDIRESNALTEGGAQWELVNSYLFQRMRDKVALWGIQINWVRIRDVTLTPHNMPLVDAPAFAEKQFVAAGRGESSQRAGQAQQVSTQQTPTMTTAKPASSPKIPKGEVLINAYNEVKNGKITDPTTIRNIADAWAALAQNPQSTAVNFDPEQVAYHLREQAKRNEGRHKRDTFYDDETKPDWLLRRPTDENLMGGG